MNLHQIQASISVAVIGVQKFVHNLLGKSVAEHHLVFFVYVDNLPESYRLKTPNFGGSQLLTNI